MGHAWTNGLRRLHTSGGFRRSPRIHHPRPAGDTTDRIVDDVVAGDADTLADQIARELPACGGMSYRSISQGWRQARFPLRTAAALHRLVRRHHRRQLDIGRVRSAGFHPVGRLRHRTTHRQRTDQLLCRSQEAHHGHRNVDPRKQWSSTTESVRTGFDPSKWGRTLDNCAMWLRRTDDGTGPDPLIEVDMLNHRTTHETARRRGSAATHEHLLVRRVRDCLLARFTWWLLTVDTLSLRRPSPHHSRTRRPAGCRVAKHTQVTAHHVP